MARRSADPAIMVMIDHANMEPRPAWGPVGSWAYWPWKQIQPQRTSYHWGLIDGYLDKAASLGKPVAISAYPYLGPGEDMTPSWVYSSGLQPHTGIARDGTTFCYPAWNTTAWDAAFADFVGDLGFRYDGDERIHSVWIATLTYGETATGAAIGKEVGHNPMAFVRKAMDWYAQAFPTTPLYILSTGPVDRMANAMYALDREIGVKHNALNGDLNNQQQSGWNQQGLLEVARAVMARGHYMAYEHFYNGKSETETYSAMICGLAHGMRVVDLPVEHLDTLAHMTPPHLGNLWDWTLRLMSYPLERLAMWVGRDTINPGDKWQGGWPGPWVRGSIHLHNAEVSKPGGALWSALPRTLSESLFAYIGVGLCTGAQLVATVEMPAGDYDITTIWSPLTDAGWRKSQVRVTLDGATTMPLVPQPCWVHMVIVEPASGDVEPPPPPPPDDLAEIREAIGKILIAQDDLNTSVNVRLDSLAQSVAHQLVAARTRIQALETWQDKVTDAIKTLL